MWTNQRVHALPPGKAKGKSFFLPAPKRSVDSHHPKMQLIEKEIVGEGIDKVGCDSSQNLRQNNSLEGGDNCHTHNTARRREVTGNATP